MTRLLLPIFIALSLAATVRAAAVDRVLRRFDFEERAAGNVEDVPMDWIKIEGPGLPHYVNGALTTEQALSGKYSFGFQLNGGSLVYRYPAGRIAAHAGARYRVRVMARSEGVTTARPQLTVYGADQDRKPIKSSVMRAAPAPAEGDGWSPIDIDFTAPPDAAWLVLELGLVQSSLWRQTSLGEAAVFEQDITGRCFFDDLTVSQVPRVRLGIGSTGNVFRRGQPAAVDVELNDRLTSDLVGRLVVRDVLGQVVYQQSGDFGLTPSGSSVAGRVPLPELPAGWYRAGVSFESGGTEVGRQSVAFVQLPDDQPGAEPDPRFGVIATSLPFDAWNDLPTLLPVLGVSRVKLSVWSAAGDIEHVPGLDFNRLIDRLQELHISPIACLVAAPPDVARWFGGSEWPRLLKAKPETWQTPLALMTSRYAGHVDRWQFGADDAAAEFNAKPALREAYTAVLAPMNELFHPADLAMPWPIYADPPRPAPAALALNVPTDVLPQHVPLYVAEMLGHGQTRVSLTLNPLPITGYGRATQLRDLAQRVGYALSAKATRIDLPLPFQAADGETPGREPSDVFLAERTLMTTLAGTTYKGRMPLGDDVEALLFDRDGEGVLMAWTKSPQAAARPVPVMLGNSPRTVDLDGNVSAVLKPRANDGTTDVTVGPVPTLVVGIDGNLAQLRSSFAFDNPLLESSYKAHVRRLTFTNPYPQTITGQLKLAGPAGWVLTPQSPTFSLAAGEKYEGVVTIEFPFSSVAGRKPVDVDVKLDGGSAFKVPLALRLGLGDLGMDSSAFRDGSDVVVQQMITNYGTKPADYTAFASYPGAARQERLVTALMPGTTVIKRYRFSNVGNDGAKIIRSGVRETQGTRVLTDEVTLP